MTAPPAGALEACPFCGGAAEMLVGYHAKYDVKISCLDCTAEGALFGTDDFKGERGSAPHEAAAIAAWNRRTHGPALLAALRLREGCEGLVDSLPSNWCDPMLTGPNAALGSGPWGCPDVERLIAAIKQRLRDDLARVLEEGE